ncbi:TRAP transporter substrate-binding protein [Acuticoccus sp. M5D2P5]|uniref:TRAP transporter substrate-binding protein n=1 Tax=Acuticoccus kalidii TaxID=2910977 RepID=UPI001F41B4E6|nr:TRAP transporter substrate-binding protein [Acuticoccus kalidii]MCF3935221.1 TRAP transporter substrate-binding protein [Acuticoccus kalidii]
MNTRSITRMGASVLLAAGMFSAATAAQAETLRLGHDQVTKHTYHATTNFFADKVNELTDGEITVNVFPSGTLGTETSMLQEVVDGNLDMSVSTTANASSFVPAFGILSVSYLFEDADHFRRAVADDTFNSLIDEMIANVDPGFIRVATITSGARSMYNSQGPVTGLDDLKGKKMRVMASPVESQVWGSLGTLPVAIPFGDVYTGMQTGLIGAAENSPGSYILNKHNEVAPYFSLTNHQWPISLIMMNKEKFEALPQEQQDAILEAGREASVFGVDNAIESDNALIEEMADYGVKVNEVETAPLVEAVAPLQDETAKNLGTEDILARIRELKN